MAEMATEDQAAMGAVSLETKARRLAARARSMDEDEGAKRGESQLRTAVAKLGEELTALAETVQLVRAVRSTGPHVDTDVELSKPMDELAKRVRDIGQPTSQYVQARTREVVSIRSTLTQAAQQGWQGWAQSQHDSLPLELIPRVEFYERERAQRVVRDLTLSIKAVPTIALVGKTRQDLMWLRSVLEKVESHELDGVIKNLPLVLADISEEDLLALRRDAEWARRLTLGLA